MNTPAPPKLKIDIPKDKIADFCRRHHIQKLSLSRYFRDQVLSEAQVQYVHD